MFRRIILDDIVSRPRGHIHGLPIVWPEPTFVCSTVLETMFLQSRIEDIGHPKYVGFIAPRISVGSNVW
jgi:hypothetical protein